MMRNKTALKTSEVHLEYTLEELCKIKEMAQHQPDHQTTFETMKRQYDMLMEDKRQIEEQKDTLNPFEAFARYRQNQLFNEATYKFICQTKIASEAMRRTVLDSVEMSDDSGDSSTEEEINDIAMPFDTEIDVRLKDVTEEAASILT
ncbi:hypothetical protein V8B97DRAFT_1579897 [Scleroderma yunnanense]